MSKKELVELFNNLFESGEYKLVSDGVLWLGQGNTIVTRPRIVKVEPVKELKS